MASRAFTARLSRAASSWWASTSTGHRPALPTASTSIISPNERCRNSTSAAMNWLRSSGFGSSGCCREKASSRCVNMAAHGVVERALQPGRHSPAQGAELALRGFEIADDDGEQIVEIVCHTAGELADGFHLLPFEQPLARLLEHFLGQMPFGDVARHFRKTDELARIVVDRIDHHACPEAGAILADAPALGLMPPFRRSSQEPAHRHAFPLLLLGVEV